MANIKSAQKNIRKTTSRTEANKASKSRLKTLSKSAASALKDSDATKIAAVVSDVASGYDKAAKTGVIHKNKASRIKSRLAKAVKTAKALKAA
ncbi:MAG: 30S ribosomal protein S20 [Puniceicoccales bacterium]|jgi:small subunit ribosomal protein S20|nr:30S ribosomal protein S20 [Puniceicoccales bacterium]